MIGDKMLVGNVEYRFKISDAVHGVVFVDTGAAWDAADKWDLNDLQSAFGLGVRFDTPLGMMRLDYGIGSEGGKFNFSIGPTF
jgi:outer membrane protein insertion porin family